MAKKTSKVYKIISHPKVSMGCHVESIISLKNTNPIDLIELPLLDSGRRNWR
jgi:hypothetical protein